MNSVDPVTQGVAPGQGIAAPSGRTHGAPKSEPIIRYRRIGFCPNSWLGPVHPCPIGGEPGARGGREPFPPLDGVGGDESAWGCLGGLSLGTMALPGPSGAPRVPSGAFRIWTPTDGRGMAALLGPREPGKGRFLESRARKRKGLRGSGGEIRVARSWGAVPLYVQRSERSSAW